MKKLIYSREEVRDLFYKNPKEIIGLTVSTLPYTTADGKSLIFLADVYNKLDSTHYGRIEIKIENLIKDIIKEEE